MNEQGECFDFYCILFDFILASFFLLRGSRLPREVINRLPGRDFFFFQTSNEFFFDVWNAFSWNSLSQNFNSVEKYLNGQTNLLDISFFTNNLNVFYDTFLMWIKRLTNHRQLGFGRFALSGFSSGAYFTNFHTTTVQKLFALSYFESINLNSRNIVLSTQLLF